MGDARAVLGLFHHPPGPKGRGGHVPEPGFRRAGAAVLRERRRREEHHGEPDLRAAECPGYSSPARFVFAPGGFGVSAVRSFVRTVVKACGSSHPFPRLYHGYRRGREDRIPVMRAAYARKRRAAESTTAERQAAFAARRPAIHSLPSQTDRSRVPFRHAQARRGAHRCTVGQSDSPTTLSPCRKPARVPRDVSGQRQWRGPGLCDEWNPRRE